MMNLRQIEAFRAVMETGSVSQAAERLAISQPAVSKLIQNLEHGTSLALFERRPGRVLPTPEAFLLFEEIERMVKGLNSLQLFVADLQAMQHASLRIGVMPALSVGFIQDILKHFADAHPASQLVVQARSTVKIVEWLVAGSIDIGLSSHPFDHPEIVQVPLCRRAYVCIMPKAHRLAGRASLSPSDFEGERFISFSPGSDLGTEIGLIFKQAGVKPRMQIEASMAPTVCALVTRGLGIALVNPLYIGDFAGVLAQRPFTPEVTSEVRLLLPRLRPQSLATRAFI
ncbi:MAG: LysR family transcriptional regulator, partial [Acetobacteraceae bacterium]|nr:LysR family transcriptional regulator [Acetobacteraceae bacterium]